MSKRIEKLKTGIAGFDFIADGGLPVGRATLLAGTTGSGKTIFATQFLAEGIRRGEPGVFVTFEEFPEDLRQNMNGMGWDIESWEAQKKWVFVDVAPRLDEESTIVGTFDLTALVARIENAVKKTGAKRLSIDSLGSIFSQVGDSAQVRKEILRLFVALKKLDVTCVITAERLEETGPLSRHAVEEFVADNVLIFRNVLQDETRRRTVEILKFRGTSHRKGEFPFTILSEGGLVVIPLASINLEQLSTDLRVNSGNADIDVMCSGGYFRDSVTLVSGATGTGKTLMVTEFLSGGVKSGEKVLLFAFEESEEQLIRNAKGWGIDFRTAIDEGHLKVACCYPEARGLEDHLLAMKHTIRDFRPDRLAVDSLSALERVSSLKSFREFVIGLSSYVKELCITSVFTSASAHLLGGTSITESNISTITDAIVLLRYVEVNGEMKRGLTVLKMRGSYHDKQIREYAIDQTGMHIGRGFRNINGILSGHQTILTREREIDRINEMFSEDSGPEVRS